MPFFFEVDGAFFADVGIPSVDRSKGFTRSIVKVFKKIMLTKFPLICLRIIWHIAFIIHMLIGLGKDMRLTRFKVKITCKKR